MDEINLLLNAGLIAQQQGAEEVTAEHIRRAKADILPYVTEELLEELNGQERLTLLSVARSLRKDPYTTFQDIQKAYISDCESDAAKPRPNAKSSAFCEAAETKPLGKTRLRSNLKRLCDPGIVEMGREERGRWGDWQAGVQYSGSTALMPSLLWDTGGEHENRYSPEAINFHMQPPSVKSIMCSEGAHEKFCPVCIRYTFHDVPVEAVVEWVENCKNY